MRKYSRIISAALCVLLIGSLMWASANAVGYLVGDVDGDGEVTILDATAIQRRLAGLPVSSAFNEKAADTDGDGLNILDATRIQRWLAGLDDVGSVGENVEEPPSADEYELPFIHGGN